MVHGPVHRPFDAVQLSCPLSRKTPSKHVSTSMFDGGDGVLGVIDSIPPPPSTASWVDAKELDFWSHLTTTFSPSSPLNHSDVHWQTSDGPGHVLSWAGGPCGHCRILVFQGVVCYQFSWWLWSEAALRSLTWSSRVVLGRFLTVLMIIESPRGKNLHEASVRRWLTVLLCFFHLRIIAAAVVTFISL